MNKFSLGVFLDVFTNNQKELQKKIDFIKHIPNLGHIEIWSEVDISPRNIIWLKKTVKKLSNNFSWSIYWFVFSFWS